MRKKDEKSKENYTSNDLKRFIGAIHEEHMEAIKVIGEQFVDVNRKLDSHSEMIGQLTEDMTMVKEDLNVVKEDLNVVKGDIEVMKSDIGIIKNDLKQKVDRTEFSTLERRVTRLESKMR